VLRAPRWALALVAACTLTVVGAGIAVLVLWSSGGGAAHPTPSPRAGAAALLAYTSALRGPTAQGGQVVEQEMKPSISDFSGGQIDGATLLARARSWQLAFTRVRQEIDAIAVPAGLEQAQRLFDAAIDGYARAADLLLQAATGPAAARDSLLDGAIAAGRQADAIYDRAAQLVQTALVAAGLPVDVDLPNPSPSA
jgi:hypothetical protein